MASPSEQTADPGSGGRTAQPECLGLGLVSSERTECSRPDSVEPPESRQDNQTVLLLPEENHSSLALPEENHSSLTLPEENQSSLTLPEENHSSLTLPEENHSSLTLPEDNQSSLTLPEDNQSSLTLPEDNQTVLLLPEENQSSLMLPEDNHSSLTLPEDNHSSLALPEDNHISLTLPEDNQSQMISDENQSQTVLLPEEKQTVLLLLGHNQEHSVHSEHNQGHENVPNPEEEEEEEEEEEAKGQGSDPDPQWVEERFRIDRKKLEFMLYAPKDGDVLTGEEFFTRVMSETHTQIKWPSKLKIGAKSKKDPHVKVEGKRRDVLEAKKKILQVLETKVNKVTLKVDVPHTEHSHVIGKGGGNIKRVMEVTSCHVHFPDSNRHQEKGRSNQVSIAGPVEGVEAARRKIRELQPLALTFDLPVTLAPQALPDAASPVVQQVAAALGVTVSFRAQSPAQPAGAPHPLYGGCCTVRGLQGYAGAVKKAVCILVDLLLGSEVGGGQAGVIVSSQLDVTSQQHVFLLAGNGAHFLGVMHQTGTQIIIPDLTAPLTPPTLLIQGPLEGVCAARQQLMECLPVCLMFDMREDRHTDAMTLSHMMHKLGVFISVKPKAKQTTKSVVIKGLERNIHKVYEARCSLLGLKTDSSDVSMTTKMAPVVADNSVAPPSGLAQYWLSMLLKTLSDQGPVPPTASTPEMLIGSHSQLKPRPSPPPGLTPPTEVGLKYLTPPTEAGLRYLTPPTEAGLRYLTPPTEAGLKYLTPPTEVGLKYLTPPTEAGLKYLTPPTEAGLKYLTPPTDAGLKMTDSRTLEKILENDDQSGQSDDESPMLMSCEVRAGLLGRRGSLQGPDAPRSFSQARRHSTGQPLSYRVLLADMEGGRADRRNSLRRETTLVPQTEDYEQKKLLATRAMQRKPVLSEVRTPTDTWSGLGFSKSMPAEELRLIGRRSSMPADELRLTGRRSSYKPYLSNGATQGQVQWACPRSNSENWRDRRGSTSSSPPVSPSSPSSSSPEHNSFPMFTSSSCRGRHDTFSESGGMSSSRRASTCSQRSPSPQQDCDRLAELLKQLGVAKYTDVFTQQEIDFQTFLTLSDEDLKEVGVATFGARRKMLLAIYDLKQRRSSDTPPTMKPAYLEGGASGRLPPILDLEAAAQSCRW